MIDGSLKYWINGAPVVPDNDANLRALGYWINGEPYTSEKTSSISVTGAGATSIGSAVSTLVDTVSVTGAGATSIGSAASTLVDTVSVTGTGAISSLSLMFNDLDNYNVKSWTVRKSIQEVMWTFNGQIDGHSVPSYFTQLQIFADDYADVTQCLFIGLIPGASYALESVNNTSNITGYDYGWYLSAQFVPESLRQTDEDTNPADTIESLLGGVDWYTTTGIEPYEIRTVSDWASIKKSYVWDAKTTKWKAIKEICEHTS
ncbi:MAG: hypothetical protein SVM80_12220, partial [Halobacteriota archaeon]|nr:hypothetical protein [Halobacteriota archaeon]